MKRRSVYVELDRVERLVVLTFSIVLNLTWFIPIVLQLAKTESGYTILLSLFLFATISIILSNYLEKRQIKKIKQRIDKTTQKHIEEFFDFIEEDKQFVKDVLHLNVKLYNFEREEIGEGSVYTQLSGKKYNFFKEIE
jgi:hypothetical protein